MEMDTDILNESKFLKHFCRLITSHELEDAEIIDYFDVVQSIVPTKLVRAIEMDGDMVSVTVTAYVNQDQHNVYEVVLERELGADEAEQIADLLMSEFDFDFEFETNLEL
jgi:hypothetical protein